LFQSEADQLVVCYYNDDECFVEEVDLSRKTANEKFSFTGTPEEKENIIFIWFSHFGRVAHLPENLGEEFPNLVRLRIWYSEIPIVKSNFFGPQFSWIEELELIKDKIKFIEEEAFQHLPNLVKIGLDNNEIRSLSAGIFKNNQKLEVIELYKNKIKMIAPETFQNLDQLRYVGLETYKCSNKDVGCSGWDCINRFYRKRLNRKLLPCYENHKNSSDLLNEGEN
jgi:Leucine-rich repeat (LRR) protein